MSFQLSRRSIIGLGAITLGTGALFAQKNSGVHSGRKLVISDQTSKDFDDLIEQNFPGFLSNPITSALRPMAYLVKNKSAEPLRALSVRWTLLTQSGPSQTVVHHAIHSSKDVALTASRSLVDAHGIALLTPFFFWNPRQYNHLRTRDLTKMLASSATSRFLASELQASTSLLLNVDGGIYRDGLVGGPLGGRTADRFNIISSAERDEAVSVALLMRAGGNADDVRKLLHKSRSRIIQYADCPRKHFFESAGKRQANNYLKMLNKMNYEKFSSVIVDIATTKPANFLTSAI